MERLALNIRTDPAPTPKGRPGSVWPDDAGGRCGQAIVAPDGRWLSWEGLGLFRIGPDGPRVDAWPLPGLDAESFARRFAREVQPIVLQARGLEAMHASAVLAPAGALVICGRSHSGKSTLSYAFRGKGWRQLADDHVVLDFRGGVAMVRPQPFTPSLRAPSAAYFGEKNAGERPAAAPRQDAVRLAAVILLEQARELVEPLSIAPVAAARGFSDLLPHAHCFDPYDPAEQARLVNHYFALVHQAPVYTVRYRPSFALLGLLMKTIERLPGVGDRVLST